MLNLTICWYFSIE